MQITKVKAHIGAIVSSIDLGQPVEAVTQDRPYGAVVEKAVLVIRAQAHLTPAQLQAAQLRGELMQDRNQRYLVDGFPLG